MGGITTEVRLEISRDNWKKKALQRRAQNKRDQKRIRELERSRDKWKNKCLSRPALPTPCGADYQKVARHTYDSGLIWLCLYMHLVGRSSLRSCRQVVVALGIYLGKTTRIPCPATIRGWVCKYGYYHYQQPKEGQQWAIIVDESVCIGQERLLLILGVDVAKWDFKRPLESADVEVLSLAVATSWTAPAIGAQIQALTERLTIVYSLSDAGNNLVATWKARNMLYISDCTHLWAKSLERVYKEDVDFRAFMQAVTALRKRWILSKSAHLLPPPTRIKSRFHQVFTYLAWAERIQGVWAELNPPQQADLAFLSDYETLLAGLSSCQRLVGQLNGLFKVKGLSHGSIEEGLILLGRDLPDLLAVSEFKDHIRFYLLTHRARLVAGQTYLCCSDIIESTFGVYKQCLSRNQGSITELVLALAGLGKRLQPVGVKKAMEAVKVRDVAAWKAENTTPSLAKIRRDFFGKKGVKE